jgi:phage gp36-like protein
MAVTQYTDLEAVRDRLSREGVDLRLDDLPPSADGDVIDRASIRIDAYLRRRYAPSQLDASDHALELATTLATYFLCTRRGNPAPGGVAADYEAALKELEMLRDGSIDLSDVPARRQAAPAMSNVRVKLRPEPHSRVVPARSSKLGGVAARRQQRQDNTQRDIDFNRQW